MTVKRNKGANKCFSSFKSQHTQQDIATASIVYKIRLGSADVYSARQTEMNKSTPNIIKVYEMRYQ